MDKIYFIIEDGVVSQPYSLNDLLTKNINESTLVCKKFEDWKKAKEIPEILENINPPNVKKSNFKSDFFEYSKLLGSKINKIKENFGIYDDIDQDQYRSYIWFQKSKALIYVDDNFIIGNIRSPTSDAGGETYINEQHSFEIDGVRQGMTKNDVLKIMGIPKWKADYVWGYERNEFLTDTNQQIEFCICFREDSNLHIPTVAFFESRLLQENSELIVDKRISASNDESTTKLKYKTQNDGEITFYSSNNIVVTLSRLVINGQTYPMRNISYVGISQIVPKYTWTSIFGILGLIFTIVSSETRPAGLFFIAIAGIKLYISKIKYIVTVQSNSGISDILTSTDRVLAEEIVDAINEAIVYRG